MAELLIVVAIMIILFGFAFAGIVNFIRNLNQTELDKTAEVIYVAAQNRMSEIYASGEAYKLTAAASGQGGMAGVAIVQNAPSDWDENVSGAYPDDSNKKLCMIASTSVDAAEYLFPENNIIAEEWRLGNWIVEYDPDSLMVYSVFFSKKLEPYSFYNDEGILRPVDAVGARRTYGATVGYYGGPVAALDHEQVKTIYCQVKTEEFNKEKLLAQIVVGNIPPITVGSGVSSDIDLTITITGESSGNTIVLTRTLTAADIDDSDPADKTKRACYLILDGLEDGEHFKDQFVTNLTSPKRSVNGDEFTVKTAGDSLIPGENITLNVQARCRNPYVNSPAPSEDSTNSLFASIDASGSDIKAEVSYGRHLQNLDSAISGFDSTAIAQIGAGKVNVFQIPNQEGIDAIDFSKNAPDSASPSVTEISPITDRIKYYYATYNTREFKSVTNTGINSYDGQKNKIIGANVVPNNMAGNKTCAGLFGEFSGSALKDMYVVNERIKGDNAGATGTIAGITKNEVSITGCMNYLKKDIDYDWADDTNASDDDWVTGGKYVGGLIGESQGIVNIDSSMSATVLKTPISGAATPTNYVGGLIGKSNSTVNIKQSYTDSYISGEQIAGMVADAVGVVNIEESYVAGFALSQSATETSKGNYFKHGAAFVDGSGVANITKAYSVFDFTDPTPDIKKPELGDFAIDSIAHVEGALNSVFYTSSDGADVHVSSAVNVIGVSKQDLRDVVAAGAAASPNVLTVRQALAGSFLMIGEDDNRNNTYPYNLTKDFDLKLYPYPLLSIRHYGDWSLFDIEPGTLVYWERYVDVNGNNPIYRFSGGGRSYLLSYEELKMMGYHANLDGYAVLFPTDDPSKAYEKDTYIKYDDHALSDTVTLTLKPGEAGNISTTFGISGKDRSFELRPLPYIIDGLGQGVERLIDGRLNRFYLPITVVNDSGRTSKYFFNPTFASTQIEVNDYVKDAIIGVANNYVSVRTPRHLYLMSMYYYIYYNVTASATFKQELDLDYLLYDWNGADELYNYFDHVYNQANYQYQIGFIIDDSYLGTYQVDFKATYDGGCRIITNVGLTTVNYAPYGMYVTDTIGLFGRIAKNATVKNVVYANNYSKDKFYMMSGKIYFDPDSLQMDLTGQTFYNGMLAGVNEGTISNCSVTGSVFNGNIESSSRLFVGGLVGYNSGVIQNCSADVPRITVNIKSSYADLGAFAGFNSGVITQSFANGRIRIPEYDGKGNQSISGFVGDNVGRIDNSYCATSKQAMLVGEKSCYGFTSPNGSTSGCYYINDDAYYYVDDLYAYSDFNSTAASAITDPKLKDASISGFGKMGGATSFNNNTRARDAGAVTYPFPTSVKDAYGNYIYYGEWPLLEGFGDFGFFYWEKEEGGAHSGYHYYLMTNKSIGDGNNKIPQIRTSLCTYHDDGGIITEYGYGYYAEKTKDPMIGESLGTVKWNNIHTGDINEKANDEIAKLFTDNNYKFHAYTTTSAYSDVDVHKMYLDTTGDDALTTGWGSVTIGKQGDGDDGLKPMTYYFSPYFAASMVREDESADSKSLVGAEKHRLQVRNTDQLQYINWNNKTKTTKVTLNEAIYGKNDGEASSTKLNETSIAFPYLGYAYAEGALTKQHHSANKYWLQTHDIDFKLAKDSDGKYFTPIGSIYDSNYKSTTDNSYVYTSYFNGDYNGGSFVIKNIQIKSDSMSVGLFGVIIGAHLDHMIVYSDQDNVIGDTNSEKTVGWYNIGGLAGMALAGGKEISIMPTVGIDSSVCSGYQIIDNRKNHGFGGANIGGLIGVSNIPIRKSLSVNDIIINPQYNESDARIRVGGIVGDFRGDIMSACYSGGSIKRIINNDDTVGTVNNDVKVGYGGLIGGWVVRTNGNLSSLIGGLNNTPKVEKSYTYADPRGYNASVANAGIRPIVNSCGETSSNFSMSFCFYYNPFGDSNYSSATMGGDNPTKVEYSKLSGDYKYSQYEDFYNIINNKRTTIQSSDKWEYDPWYRVTTYQLPEGDKKYHRYGGKKVDGAFSFHASDASLQGKNYPFPTVIDQVDIYDEIVHVHYGAWPKSDGIFTSQIEAGLDLLSPIDKSIKIDVSLYDESIGQVDILESEITNLTISKSSGGEPEFVTIDKASGAVGEKLGIVLTFNAIKTGSEKLTLSFVKSGKTYTANIDVRVTAEVTVTAVPMDLRAEGEFGYDPEHGPDLAIDPYVHHKNIKYKLTAYNIRNEELSDGEWQLEPKDVPDYDHTICTAELDDTEKTLTVTTLAKGETTIRFSFVSNVGTGHDEEKAKSDVKSIMVVVQETPQWNIQEDEKVSSPSTEGEPTTQSLDDGLVDGENPDTTSPEATSDGTPDSSEGTGEPTPQTGTDHPAQGTDGVTDGTDQNLPPTEQAP